MRSGDPLLIYLFSQESDILAFEYPERGAHIRGAAALIKARIENPSLSKPSSVLVAEVVSKLVKPSVKVEKSITNKIASLTGPSSTVIPVPSSR